jgi:hypothetical protein
VPNYRRCSHSGEGGASKTGAVNEDGRLYGDSELVQLIKRASPSGRTEAHPGWRQLSVALGRGREHFAIWEFIRDLHSDSSLRKKQVEQILLQMIEHGGPLLYHGGEDQQRPFDSTCRKYRRFLSAPAR